MASYRRPPRVGTRVVFDPNPVSHMMYSGSHLQHLPNRGGKGTVTTISGRSSMRGPGGGLVYVKWDDTDVSGASLGDIVSAKAWTGKSRWAGVRMNPKGSRKMAKKKSKRRARKNPTHKVETTKAGRRLRPSAGSVRKSAKLLNARKRAIAAGEKPPTRFGDLDYRAAEWKIQRGKKKRAAAKKRASSSKPRAASKPRARRARATKPVTGRFVTIGRYINSVADRWY